MKLSLFTSSTQVCTFFCHFIGTAFKVENTERLDYPKPDSNAVNSSETISQLGQKSSASPTTQGQPQESTSSSSDAHAAHGAPSFQRATPEELDDTSPRITHERNPSSNDLPSQPSGVNDKPRDIAGHHAKLVAPDVSSEKEIARSEDERLVKLERKLSAVLAAQTERDQRMSQLTDGLERKLSAMVAAQTKRDRRIAQLTDELAQNSALLKQAEANVVEVKKSAGLEQRELQAKKLDKLVLSCAYALEQAQCALQATSRTAEANERSQRELAEVRAELEASKSELAAVHLRPKDAESGWAKNKAEADTSGAKTAANLVDTDEDGVTRRLMERVRALEAKIASPRLWNEKSFEMMECTNED